MLSPPAPYLHHRHYPVEAYYHYRRQAGYLINVMVEPEAVREFGKTWAGLRHNQAPRKMRKRAGQYTSADKERSSGIEAQDRGEKKKRKHNAWKI
jgi:hypothetical protein